MSQPQSEQMIRMPIAAFLPSPYNRERAKRYSKKKLEDLGEAMLQHGQIEPVIARFADASGTTLELIAGERRWRAAEIKGLPDLLVIIRTLDDRAVCGVMLSENLDRENPSAVEKADIFADMLTAKDATSELIYPSYKALAEAVGAEEQDIKSLMKLREAPDFLLEAVEDERKLAVATAVAVGRIPTKKDREKAAREILTPEGQEVPMNYEQAKSWIREKYMVPLISVGFDIHDATLVPIKDDALGQRICGGACPDCVHYAGQIPELQEGLAVKGGKGSGGKSGVNPKTCTNPTGVRMKQDAAWRIVKESAETRGMRVIEGDAARKVFGGWQGTLSHDAGYVDLEAKPQGSDVNYRVDTDKLPKWGKLVNEGNVERIAAKHPITGKVVYLAPKKEALQLLKTEVPAVAKADPGAAQARAEGKLATAKTHVGMEMLFDAVQAQGVDDKAQQLMLEIAVANAGSDGTFCMGKWLGLSKSNGNGFEDAIMDHVDGLLIDRRKAGESREAALKQLLEAFTAIALISKYMKWQDVSSKGFKALAEHYKLDLKALTAQAKAKVGTKGKKAAAPAPDPDEDEDDEGIEATGTEAQSEESETLEEANESGDLEERLEASFKVADAEASRAPKKLSNAERAQPEQEANALKSYLETGSLELTAEATGIKLGTIQNWHKRRGWAKQRKEAAKK